MKTKFIFAVIVLIASLSGSVAFAGGFDSFNKTSDRAIAIPGTQPNVSDLDQCRFEVGVLENQLEEAEAQLEEKEARIRHLQTRLRATACSTSCRERGLDGIQLNNCLISCQFQAARGEQARWN